MENLGDLCKLYVVSYVLLLDCVIQQYRAGCIDSYNLDPVHYFTAPALTWDTGLKHTKEIFLELLEKQEMYIFLEQAIRGGTSTITHRFAKANNHLKDYNPTKPESFLAYIDANNL